MDRGSLEFMTDTQADVSEQVIAAVIFQVLWGLGYLHYDNRIVSLFLNLSLYLLCQFC